MMNMKCTYPFGLTRQLLLLALAMLTAFSSVPSVYGKSKPKSGKSAKQAEEEMKKQLANKEKKQAKGKKTGASSMGDESTFFSRFFFWILEFFRAMAI